MTFIALENIARIIISVRGGIYLKKCRIAFIKTKILKITCI